MTTAVPAARVSVVMPTYKRPAMLREALGSVLGQTLREIEVIVCDNADDPETRAVVESWADPRVTYVGRPTNIGMIGNALDGFRRATGELVIKLDDDDAFLPQTLETLAAPFEGRPELTASFCDLLLVDAEGRTLEQETEDVQRDTGRSGLRPGVYAPFDALAAGGAVSLSGALLRRAAIDWDAVPEQAGTSYDLYLTVAAARGGAAAWYTKEPLVRYRIHGANDSVKNVVPSLEASRWILEQAVTSGEHQQLGAFRDRIAVDDARLAREYLLEGRAAEARRAAARSLRHSPRPQPLATLALASLPRGLGRQISARRRAQFLADTSARHTERP